MNFHKYSFYNQAKELTLHQIEPFSCHDIKFSQWLSIREFFTKRRYLLTNIHRVIFHKGENHICIDAEVWNQALSDLCLSQKCLYCIPIPHTKCAWYFLVVEIYKHDDAVYFSLCLKVLGKAAHVSPVISYTNMKVIVCNAALYIIQI
jgi:hypothetical protein